MFKQIPYKISCDPSEKYSSDQILWMLQHTDMGVAPDVNTVQGKLSGFVDGSLQAIFNLMKDADHYLNTSDKAASDPNDIWYAGYNAIMNIYKANKP